MCTFIHLKKAKFWPIPAQVWFEMVKTGINSFVFFLPGINSFLRIWAQKLFPGPGDAIDG